MLGRRPGQVVTDIKIPFERPRDLAIGETVAFNTICGDLRTTIAESHAAVSRSDSPAQGLSS